MQVFRKRAYKRKNSRRRLPAAAVRLWALSLAGIHVIAVAVTVVVVVVVVVAVTVTVVIVVVIVAEAQAVVKQLQFRLENDLQQGNGADGLLHALVEL